MEGPGSKVPALLLALSEDLDIQATSNKSPEFVNVKFKKIYEILFSFKKFDWFYVGNALLNVTIKKSADYKLIVVFWI